MDQSKNDLKQQALNYLRTICKPYAPIGIAITGPDQRHQLDDGSSYTTFWNENQSTLHLIYYSSIGSTKYKTFTLPPPKKTLPLHRQYWQAGFTILPLKGKRPIHPNWPTTPYQTESDLLQLEGEGLGNFGVLCQGWLIIDIDARNGGVESYQKLLQQLPELPDSGFIVKTGSGGGSQHIYYLLPLNTPKLQSKHHDYPGIDFKTTGQVVGAGSIHPETKQPYEIEHGSPSTITEAPSRLIELLKREEPSFQPKPMPKIVSTGDRTSQIVAMLEHINPDVGYEDWIRIGMGIHHETYGSETGYEIWYAWSSRGTKFKAKEMRTKWKSFSGGGVTFGTLISLAKAHGYVPTTLSCNNFQSVEKTIINKSPLDDGPTWTNEPFIEANSKELEYERTLNDELEECALNHHPILKNIKEVDLTNPPGIVGEVTRFIDSQGKKKRIHLAVAGALCAVADTCGLGVTDDGWEPYGDQIERRLINDRAVPNLYIFGVADSGSGKDSILNATKGIIKRTVLKSCVLGGIKSQQEMVRNLLRNQANFYFMDEIGYKLSKIGNASKNGISYLEGVPAELMTMYSNSSNEYEPTGDVMHELIEKCQEEIGKKKERLEKAEEKGMEDSKRRERSVELEQARLKLKSAEKGIIAPFVNVFGVTTPQTFEKLVDRQSVCDGFFTRALIVIEKEPYPRGRTGVLKKYLPESLTQLIEENLNRYSLENNRVEFEADSKIIVSDEEALVYLQEISDYFDDLGVYHTSTTGLHPIFARARELVQKVSLILSLGVGYRTWEHVNWAFAYVLRDVKTKVVLAISNDGDDAAFERRIVDFLAKYSKPQGVGTIANRTKINKGQCQKIIDNLVDKGVVTKESRKGKNGTFIMYSIF